MALISIGGTALPKPTGYKVSLQDLDSDSTSRSESGVLIRDRVRAGVYKIFYKTTATKAQMQTLMGLISAAKLSVTFLDTNTGSTVTKDMYVGDRDCDLAVMLDDSDPSDSYWNIEFNLIQF